MSAPPAAIRVLELLAWRYSWARGRLTRLVPMVSYWWDGGAELELYWSCPAAPMPPRALSRLTGALWRGATVGADGLLRPAPAARLVHLAVQACRPGRGHEDDWADFVRLSAAPATGMRMERTRTPVARPPSASGRERGSVHRPPRGTG